ncbi:AMP-dependent synthetase/ligase [Anatilimnocola aggregata]|nr:AMP-binding protein [Anatilimnocola aggregata]
MELLARRAAEGASSGGLLVIRDRAELYRLKWAEIAELACAAADILAKRGVGPGDRVTLAAGNSLAWIVADFAVQIIGAVLVPLHTSLSPSQFAWQIQHSGSLLTIVDEALAPRLLAVAEMLNPAWEMLTLAATSNLCASGSVTAGRLRWQRTLETVTPDSLTSIVYTSGTSGDPKGVMLTQGNLAANALGIVAGFGRQPTDVRLNALPFSHAYGRMSDLLVSLAGDTWLALAQSRETYVRDAQLVQPTLMVAVPALLGRLQQGALAQFGPSDPAAIQKLLGGHVRGFISGGARLEPALLNYFAAQQTPVYEGYGLTEAAPVVTLSSPASYQAGTVGCAVPGIALKTITDGELLVHGPNVMAGYWQDAAATSEVLAGGWLHTGDLATIDGEGLVTLGGRKKEFIALATGKKVWPATIESLFDADSLIRQIMVIGEGERSLGALVVLKNTNAAEHDGPAVRQQVLAHLAAQLQHLAAHEQIRRVWLLPNPWTAEQNELTPKLTLRRPVILQRYADCVRQMFCDD